MGSNWRRPESGRFSRVCSSHCGGEAVLCERNACAGLAGHAPLEWQVSKTDLSLSNEQVSNALALPGT